MYQIEVLAFRKGGSAEQAIISAPPEEELSLTYEIRSFLFSVCEEHEYVRTRSSRTFMGGETPEEILTECAELLSRLPSEDFTFFLYAVTPSSGYFQTDIDSNYICQ